MRYTTWIFCTLFLFFPFVADAQTTNTKIAEIRIPLPDSLGVCKAMSADNQILKRYPCSPLILANGIIVRQDELMPDLIDSINVRKCSEITAELGALSVCGIISIRTKQSFAALKLSEIGVRKFPTQSNSIRYFLNGRQEASSEILISKNAIRNIEIYHTQSADASDKIYIISILTFSKKELKRFTKQPGLSQNQMVIRKS